MTSILENTSAGDRAALHTNLVGHPRLFDPAAVVEEVEHERDLRRRMAVEKVRIVPT